jgi:hypothetical protein
LSVCRTKLRALTFINGLELSSDLITISSDVISWIAFTIASSL